MEGASRSARSSHAYVLVTLAAFGSAIAACEGPTSIAVTVTADVPCATLRGVTIQAGAPSAAPSSQTTTTQCADRSGQANIGTIVIVPAGDDEALVAIRVLAGIQGPVEACRDGAYNGCIVARRAMRFVAGKELDLPITLRGACTGIACDGGTTCIRGICASATVVDGARCVGATCDEDGFGGSGVGAIPQPDGGGPMAADGGACGSGEKSCGGQCVSAADPAYGCTRVGCTPCAGNDVAEFACAVDACRLVNCRNGQKACGESCFPMDPAHGCAGMGCAPCESANGTASCVNAACALDCNAGYKLCDGRCVSVDDPTYGCGPTSCDASACPDLSTGGGTLVCSSGKCMIGTCPAGTKVCNQRCVPTDVANGCEAANRCTKCAAGEVCKSASTGAPTTCTCVDEPLATTCKLKPCGPAKNNCGKDVTCPNTCLAPNECVNTGTAYTCTCITPSTACSGYPCGYPLLDPKCNVYITCTDAYGCYPYDPGGGGG